MPRSTKLAPALVRFDRLENFHRCFAPTLYRSAVGIFKFLGSLVEGKLSLAVRSRTHSYTPQDVESRTKVMNGIPGYGSKSERGLLTNPNPGIQCPCSWLILLEKLIWVGFVEGGNRYSEITDVLFGTFDFDSATRSPVGNERAQVQGDNRGTISRRNASLVGSAGR